MAAKALLSCLKKRDLLNNDSAEPAELIRLGQQYLEEDRLSDAIDFFEKAGYREGMLQLTERCLEEGDYFLYQRLLKILGLTAESEQWTRLGDNALARGKLTFARSAYRQADNPEKLAQIERLLNLPAQEQVPDKDRLH